MRTKWRLIALLSNIVAIGSFAFIAFTSDQVLQPFLIVLERQFEAILRFYDPIAMYVVFIGGSIAIATILAETLVRRSDNVSTTLNSSVNGLFYTNAVIGVASIAANLIPLIAIILLNAFFWALGIALFVLIIGIIIKILFGSIGTSSASTRARSKPASTKNKSESKPKPRTASNPTLDAQLSSDRMMRKHLEMNQKIYDDYSKRSGWW